MLLLLSAHWTRRPKLTQLTPRRWEWLRQKPRSCYFPSRPSRCSIPSIQFKPPGDTIPHSSSYPTTSLVRRLPPIALGSRHCRIRQLTVTSITPCVRIPPAPVSGGITTCASNCSHLGSSLARLAVANLYGHQHVVWSMWRHLSLLLLIVLLVSIVIVVMLLLMSGRAGGCGGRFPRIVVRSAIVMVRSDAGMPITVWP